MTQRHLVLLGAGDLGREILYAAQDAHASLDTTYVGVAFVDDDTSKHGSQLEGIPVVGWSHLSDIVDDRTDFICAVGSPVGRAALLASLRREQPNARFGTVVHASVVRLPNVGIAEGAYVGPNTTLATGTVLDAHCVVNQNVSVGHDCRVGAQAVVSPNCTLSGRTDVGAGAFLGSGAVTYPGVSVGEGCTVSALAVVARKLAPGKKLIAKPNTMLL